jgi:hypothetical protein
MVLQTLKVFQKNTINYEKSYSEIETEKKIKQSLFHLLLFSSIFFFGNHALVSMISSIFSAFISTSPAKIGFMQIKDFPISVSAIMTSRGFGRSRSTLGLFSRLLMSLSWTYGQKDI